MAKKTYNEKLHNSGDLPKIEDLSGKPETAARFGGTRLLVAAPLQYTVIQKGKRYFVEDYESRLVDLT